MWFVWKSVWVRERACVCELQCVCGVCACYLKNDWVILIWFAFGILQDFLMYFFPIAISGRLQSRKDQNKLESWICVLRGRPQMTSFLIPFLLLKLMFCRHIQCMTLKFKKVKATYWLMLSLINLIALQTAFSKGYWIKNNTCML